MVTLRYTQTRKLDPKVNVKVHEKKFPREGGNGTKSRHCRSLDAHKIVETGEVSAKTVIIARPIYVVVDGNTQKLRFENGLFSVVEHW